MSHAANGSVISPQGTPHGVLIVAVSGGNSKRFGSPHLMQWTAPIQRYRNFSCWLSAAQLIAAIERPLSDPEADVRDSKLE